MAYFCTVTGVRIVAPGVSKAVDLEKGHDEYSEITVEEFEEAKQLREMGAELELQGQPLRQVRVEGLRDFAQRIYGDGDVTGPYARSSAPVASTSAQVEGVELLDVKALSERESDLAARGAANSLAELKREADDLKSSLGGAVDAARELAAVRAAEPAEPKAEQTTESTPPANVGSVEGEDKDK